MMRKAVGGLVSLVMALSALWIVPGTAYADGWFHYASYGGNDAGKKACVDAGRYMVWTHNDHIKNYQCIYGYSSEGYYVWNLRLYMVA